MERRKITTNEAQEIQLALYEQIQNEIKNGEDVKVLNLVSAFKQMSELIIRAHQVAGFDSKMVDLYNKNFEIKRQLNFSRIVNVVATVALIFRLLK